MEKQRTYFCIDMKSFFASVECAERGLNPFETKLVVADESRGRGALCLAVSPKMKALGTRNRCRLFEIPSSIKDYIIAMPRMRKYIDYAADIYAIYLKYIDKQDIHVYSIDESFIDATDYLKMYNMKPKEFATMLMNEIATTKGIPATAGIGTNLYLAKIALDITAKKVPDHIGYLDEKTYQETLWHHTPITDFWMVAKGTAKRLIDHGIYDMYGVAHTLPNLLYKEFGINAELLIDHAWGREPCLMEDIKNYKGKSQSVSSSQILFRDYSFDEARIVMMEMVQQSCYELMRRHQISNIVNIGVGYSNDVIASTGGHARMTSTTNICSVIKPYVEQIFDETTDRRHSIRRLGISFGNVCDECNEGYDLFVNFDEIQKEKLRERTVLGLMDRYGKNAVVKGIDLQEAATTMTRNKLIGGHNAE